MAKRQLRQADPQVKNGSAWNWIAIVTAGVGITTFFGATVKSYLEPVQLQEQEDNKAIASILKRFDAAIKEQQDKDWDLQRERGQLDINVKDLLRRVDKLEGK